MSSEEANEEARGLIRTFIGGGKGKTWAALGFAMRAVAFGMKAHVVQFNKPDVTGEPLFLMEKQVPLFKIDSFGQHCPFSDLLKSGLLSCPECRKCFLNPRSIKNMDSEYAELAFELCQGVARSGEYDVLVMDEVLRALHFKLINLEDLLTFLKEKPQKLEIIMTGPAAPGEIIRISHSVTYMLPVKRPSSIGRKLRRGIDF